jgi:hypothetical protein
MPVILASPPTTKSSVKVVDVPIFIDAAVIIPEVLILAVEVNAEDIPAVEAYPAVVEYVGVTARPTTSVARLLISTRCCSNV